MAGLTLEKRIDLYRLPRLNRSLEERLVLLYRQGRMVGGLYRSLGQEATSVGSAFALEKGDVLGPLIRNLGSVLVMGYSAREVLTRHMGRATSPSGGKEGNLHFGRFESLDAPVVRVTAPDTPVPFSPTLEEFFLPNAEKVCRAARALVGY